MKRKPVVECEFEEVDHNGNQRSNKISALDILRLVRSE